MNARAVLDADRWADRFAPAGGGTPPDEPERSVERAPAGVAAIVVTGLLVGALAVVSFLDVLDNGDADPTTAASPATTAAPDPADETEPADDAGSDASSSVNTTTVAPTDDAPADAEDAATDVTDAASESAIDEVSSGDLSPQELATALLDAPRSAVFSGGVVYLRGSVPAAEVGEAIAARAAAVVGPDNVVNEYVVDPEAPLPESAPLYVEDVVLFELDDATLNPAFVPLLELGTTLMQQVPTVEITVIAHTDSTGSNEYNLALSERRAEAVKAFWIESGIDADRVTAIGLGEEAPVSPNSGALGRAANRRAEFIVQGILG